MVKVPKELLTGSAGIGFFGLRKVMISISTGTNLRYHITTKDQVLSPPQAAYKMNPEVGNTQIFLG